MIEPILSDTDKVTWNTCYVVDGEMVVSPLTGSVRQLKDRFRAREVRHCDVYGRLKQAEKDLFHAKERIASLAERKPEADGRLRFALESAKTRSDFRGPTFQAFVAAVVAGGMREARKDYASVQDAQKLAGAIEGLAECLLVTTSHDLEKLLFAARKHANQTRHTRSSSVMSLNEEYAVARLQEIRWVADVVSVRLDLMGLKQITSAPPHQAVQYEAKIRANDQSEFTSKPEQKRETSNEPYPRSLKQ